MGLFYDRAAMTVSGTPGVGTITLGSAYYKHQTFAAAGVTNGQLVSYAIEDGASWEVGKGTYSSSGPTLARTTIYFSSNSNAAINASSSAVVFVTLTAEDISPAGSTGQIQYNNAGAFAASGNLTWDSANNFQRINGSVSIGTAWDNYTQFTIAGTAPVSGGNSYAFQIYPTLQATATVGVGNIVWLATSPSTALTSYQYYSVVQWSIGAGTTITNQYGYYVSGLTAATNNYGFYSNITSATGRYNFYAAGTADNQFSGNVLIFGAGGLGYTTGSGGTVTQATSRTTGVTLNKTNGAITLVSAAGSASYQSFTVTNSAVAATDTIILNQKSGTDKYILLVTNVASGSFQITFATTGGTTTEQPVINFAVIKAVTA